MNERIAKMYLRGCTHRIQATYLCAVKSRLGLFTCSVWCFMCVLLCQVCVLYVDVPIWYSNFSLYSFYKLMN